MTLVQRCPFPSRHISARRSPSFSPPIGGQIFLTRSKYWSPRASGAEGVSLFPPVEGSSPQQPELLLWFKPQKCMLSPFFPCRKICHRSSPRTIEPACDSRPQQFPLPSRVVSSDIVEGDRGRLFFPRTVLLTSSGVRGNMYVETPSPPKDIYFTYYSGLFLFFSFCEGYGMLFNRLSPPPPYKLSVDSPRPFR